MSFETAYHDFTDKARGYEALARDIAALLAGERDWIANTANATALLYDALPDLNWVGVYVPTLGRAGARELIVGPFQGKPACVRIAMGRGVCGTAAVRRETIVVADVNAFDGHIACDSASRSEIVVPLLRADRQGDAGVVGVLDVDSPRLARFDEADRAGLERIANLIVAASDWP